MSAVLDSAGRAQCWSTEQQQHPLTWMKGCPLSGSGMTIVFSEGTHSPYTAWEGGRVSWEARPAQEAAAGGGGTGSCRRRAAART